MSRRRCCVLWTAPALMVPLMFAVAGLSKHSIEKSLTNRARAALEAKGLNDVTVRTHGWGDIRLAGPAAERDAALASVEGMAHRDDAHRITYAPTGSASSAPATTVAPDTTAAPATTAAATTVAPDTTPSPAPTTTAAPTTTSAPSSPAIDVTAVVENKKIVLSGFVNSETTRKTLVDAATQVYGAANVTDQLTVKPSAATSAIDDMVGQTATALGLFSKDVASGSAHLVDTSLTVTGVGNSAAGAAEVNAALAVAAKAGIKVTGQVTEPAAADTAGLQKTLDDLLALHPINFAYSKADISTDAATTLDQAAAAIAKLPAAKVNVAGYTDSTGNAAGNKRLSQRRADAVRAYLVGKGVPEAQLTATGFGADNPMATNDTEEGRAANRRIAFIVGS